MQALPPELLRFAQGEFHRIHNAYGEALDVPLPDFHTDGFHCGHIVVLEHGDNVDDLSTIGITGGLRASLVECVERYQLEELAVWRVLILFVSVKL